MSRVMTHKKLANHLVVAFLLTGLAPTAAAIDFEVKSRTGPVSRYSLKKGAFEQIEPGQIIGYGTLIHVGEGGKVKFEATENSSYETDDIKVLELNTPGVIRLPSHLRKTEAEEYALKDMAKGGNGAQPTEKPILDFKQAWQRLTAVLTLPAEKKKLPKVAKEIFELDINTAGYLGKIAWQYPLGDLTVFSRAYPKNLEIFWRSEKIHGGKYRVYFWPINKSRAPAVDRVLSDRYNLSIPSDGSYYLQVTSLDGMYRTPKLIIHAAAPGKNGNGEAPSKVSTLVNLKTHAGEMLPPDNFVIFGKAKETPLTFSWKFPEVPGSPLPNEYEFVLTNSKSGKNLFKHKTKATSMSISLPEHGDYEWQVTAFNGPSYQKSTFQSLNFLEQTPDTNAIESFIKNVRARKPGTFLISSDSN